MSILHVVKLDSRAKLPTIAHLGEDLGYDIFALEDCWIYNNNVTKVRTGIGAKAYKHGYPLGMIVKDRSSMAIKGVFTHGGVLDSGWTGELCVLMTTMHPSPYFIRAGDKIAQMVPVPVLTGEITEVLGLEPSSRGDQGFGSSGQ
jgi:dUTP pyrophosphatase